jgi:hypothetical protein
MSPGTYGKVESPLGYVKVECRSIDAVELNITSELPFGYGKIDDWLFPPGYRVTYFISFLVHGEILENLERDLKAETKPMKTGLFGKRILGFEWKGGRLAEILGADSDLNSLYVS